MKGKNYKIVSLYSFFPFQENLILDLKNKLLEIDERINRLKVDLSYVTRPKKLQEINSKEFKLLPIFHEDMIEYKND